MDNLSSDDALFFVEDDTNDAKTIPASELGECWNILIIDDDPDVHSATMFALHGIKIQHRPLHFLHAYSTAEARQILIHSQDIAVILLDVVMEKDDTGLQLVAYIRDTLGLADVRIILRTGQAGYAPEMDAIRDYDINDYKNKTELTQAKLFTAVTSAVRSYEQIKIISSSKQGLEVIIGASGLLMTTNNLNEFTQLLLEYVFEILGEAPPAFVCTANFTHTPSTHNVDFAPGLRVIACSDHYETWREKPFVLVAEKLEQHLVQVAQFEQRHLFETHHTVLYLSNLAGATLAIYIKKGLLDHPEKIRLLQTFSSNASVCLDNVMLNSKMHNLAFYDPLTGLNNRLQLLQNIHQTLNSVQKSDSTLALIDIDHFAETNDALGHQFGDYLLRAVGMRLSSHFADNCKIARIGNDIFALLGHEIIVSPGVILSLFSRPFFVDQQRVQLTATLGLVKFSDYELTAADALKDANIALKRAKLHQRSGYSYFTRDMGVEIRERVRMMHALRAAFEGERLFVVFQPQIHMQSGRATGAEVLLRWKTEDGSLIPPDKFIPIAEYSGLIVNIGEWVLRTACFELLQIQKIGLHDFRMAVNVSQAQFSHPNFLRSIERALSDTRVRPDCIELEITESMAMTDPEMLIATLDQIKALGVRVSIDDFGTGFSSLSHLQKLKVDKLKIDRAFVNEIVGHSDSGGIAKMIVQLSQSLNLEVIAEGVENLEQAQALLSYGCEQAQGFYYAKPMPKQELLLWLQSQSHSH
ncbi:bifunctional diguanylate cyclase/phosphodiesterase [Undibacterium fentianense]|uniref:EAL domain-containing protein n=1 Tax=Undibacterium fentianense TaxID=2828728 RepID=A0A941E069_9BURK|nr:EAL domain-containing protein [Undibacterium fentianense]MBR7798597.1 EAL domain-containing protein [Undibacterium fentianense]